MSRIMRNKKVILTDEQKFFKLDPDIKNQNLLRTPEDIVNYARANGFIKGSSVDIQRMIEENPDIILKFESIKEDGHIIYSEQNRKYIITININHTKERRRFTMAHEYVHYCINKDIIQNNVHKDSILYRDSTTKLEVDIVANKYASEILMPIEEFRKSLQQYSGDIFLIAQQFEVSTLAVRYRAYDLGYSDRV